MPFPSIREDVPRDEVHGIVRLMLLNPEVADVECRRQADGKYTVTPSKRNDSD